MALAPPVRPKFNSLVTSDRLREGAGLRIRGASNIRKGRTSIFREEMGDDETSCWGPDAYLVAPGDKYSTASPAASAPGTATTTVIVAAPEPDAGKPWYAKLASRPGLPKRLSSQGRAAVPSVTLSTEN